MIDDDTDDQEFVDPYSISNKKNKFAPGKWKGHKHSKSPDNFVGMYGRINDLNPTLVIDAGCGKNQHKPHIKNLIGIDASPHPEVDICTTILDADIVPGSVDAVLALGSLQYLSSEYISENIERVVSWLRPGGLIEMRVAVRRPNQNQFWDDDYRKELTEKHNLEYVQEPNQFMLNINGREFVQWTWRKK
jgi:hypothetical protein